MKHYLLLAGLFACVLSASAQKVGTKPNVINQGINPMTQTDNRGKFINEQRVRDMQHDNLMADKHKPSRSIVVTNEQWRNTKIVEKDANGNVTGTTEVEFLDNGNIKSKVSSFYQDGQIIGGYMITYEYDDNGNITKEVESKLVAPPNTYAKTRETVWVYNGSPINTLYYYLDYDDTGAISHGYKSAYEFDSFGHMTMQEESYYVNNEWKPSSRQEWKWDGNYRYMSLRLYDWDNTTKKWQSGNKEVSEERTPGKVNVVYGKYDWDAAKQDWVVNGEQKEGYNEYGDLILYSYLENYGGVYTGWRYNIDIISEQHKTVHFYDWSQDTNDWIETSYSNEIYDENGNIATSSMYNSDNKLESTSEYTWEKFNIGTDVYPDCYIVGEASEWQFENSLVGKDMGNGIVVWNDVTIKNGEMFKFASDDWMTFDWGTAYDGEYIPFDQPVKLTNKGMNIKLDMEGTEMTFKSISINVLTGVVAFETYPTSVGSPEAKRVNIFANNGKIVVQNAKDVKVYSASGELISTAAVTPVEKGLYVVKAGGKTVKLNVN
ncbi:hypothetical protein [Prevotella merdae]|uniref:hypothetical protein n=1 Tax=Prevotella merdae TaxID=2079531 RepID=UPI000D0F4CAD|nr:hypothetical protein [Prevotella merdae]